MKAIMIFLNIAIVSYGVHLFVGYEPMAAAINRVVLEVVAGLI
jgi:hypothetical protein